MTTEQPISGLVDAAIEIATARRLIIEQMREALKGGDYTLALNLAKQLCGVNDEQTGNRIN